MNLWRKQVIMMRRTQSWILGAILASTAVCASAEVGNTHLGTVDIGHHYAYSFSLTAPGSFTDYVDFDLMSAADVSDSLKSHKISGLNVDLQELVGHSWVNIVSGFTSDDLSKGDYRLDITGSTSGNSGSTSSLSGTLKVAAATPEPSTWLLMLAGGAMLVLVERRRRGSAVYTSADPKGMPLNGGTPANSLSALADGLNLTPRLNPQL
jgi:hypothetical protein